jgi:hypothetical protein
LEYAVTLIRLGSQISDLKFAVLEAVGTNQVATAPRSDFA